MIDTYERAWANGMPHGPGHFDRNEDVAALAQKMCSPLAAIWNAVHLLSLARDEATVDKVQQMITRQVEHMSHVLDEARNDQWTGATDTPVA